MTDSTSDSRIPHNKRLVQQQFGANAAAYGSSRVHAEGASLTRLVELLRPQPDWRVLDVATGAGHTALALAPYVANVIATDITSEMIAVAQELIGKKGLSNLGTRLADAESLPFATSSFDLVTCRIAPHHFERIDVFMHEAHRVLKTGGLMALVDNVTPEDTEAARQLDAIERLRDPSHVHCLSVSEWRAAFAAAGFVIEHEELMDKALHFAEWSRRMTITDIVQEELRHRFSHLSPRLEEFLRPQRVGDDFDFMLVEALIIGRKQR